MKQNKMNISVIGCGWMGLPLCEALMTSGFEVITTTTTASKKKALSEVMNILLLDVVNDFPDQKLLDSDLIIYTIPPLGLQEVEHFFHVLNPDQKIIYISSTSVYGKSHGPVNENSVHFPETNNAKYLSDSESFLRSQFSQLTIVRPGGLYGEDRHPIHSLQGKTELLTGNELLHLVHRDDVIEAIMKIIENQIWSEDFNLVSDLRIPKRNYYPDLAKKLGLIPPLYKQTEDLNPTNISNEKSKNKLSLMYRNT